MLINQILTSLKCGNQLLDLSDPIVMGIINVTPDSFYKPSRAGEFPGKILETASKMAGEGAKIIDVGGMSSRPGATEIDPQEEADRVLPVVEMLSSALPDIVISIDTYRAGIAEAAIRVGATMVNDISGGNLDPGMKEIIARYKVPYILMHMKGRPSEMQNMAHYQDLTADLIRYFVNKLRELHRLDIRDIVIDPGFGFSKTMDHNYQIIAQLDQLRFLGYPIMVGVSRKSTLSKTIERPAEDALHATTALHMAALLKGASILRVHDVKPAMDAIAVYSKLHEVKNH